MAQVTTPGAFHTAASAHLEGIDFAGKTGTAQVIGHDALAKTGKGHDTVPNAWFVGVAPRRNPDIAVAVLWEHGNGGFNSARLAAQVVNAYVTKARQRDHNLRIADVPKPEASSSEPAKSDAPSLPSATNSTQPGKRVEVPAA